MYRRPFGVFLTMLLAGCAPDAGLKPLPPVAAVGGPEFQQSVGHLLGAGFTRGNRITTLQNGDQIFPAMLQAIRGAKRTITFETYVFEKGDIPQAFAEAF